MNMAALEITLGMTCKKKKKSVTKVKTKKEKLEPDYEQQIILESGCNYTLLKWEN